MDLLNYQLGKIMNHGPLRESGLCSTCVARALVVVHSSLYEMCCRADVRPCKSGMICQVEGQEFERVEKAV